MIKLCPFCDQPFNFNLLKNHIGKIHLGLDNIPSEEPIVETTAVNIEVEPVNIKPEPSNEKDEILPERPNESNIEKSISIKNEPTEIRIPSESSLVHDEITQTLSNKELKSEYANGAQVEQKNLNEEPIGNIDEDNSEPMYFEVKREQSEPMECDSTYVNIEESNKDQYQCTYCGKAYSNKANCKRHMEAEHEGLRYECIHCGKKLKHRQGLFKHVAKCSFQSENPSSTDVQAEKTSSSPSVQVNETSSSNVAQSKKTSSSNDAQLETLRSKCHKMKLFCNDLQSEKISSSNNEVQPEKTSSNVEDLLVENFIDDSA